MSSELFRFRPSHRLLLGKEYSAVFANRRVLRGGPFELYYRPIISTAVSTDAGTEADTKSETVAGDMSARLGLVIPKRNAKRAVHRNLVKRLAREAFRHVRTQLPPFDLVLRLGKPLFASPTARVVEAHLWREQLDQLFARLPKANAATEQRG